MFEEKSAFLGHLRPLICLLFTLPVISNAQAQGSSYSVEASQVATVKTPQEATALIKNWDSKIKSGVQSMLQQELSVSKEIESSYERLVKTCEIAAALKENAPRFDTSRAVIYQKQFQDRIEKLNLLKTNFLNKNKDDLAKVNSSSSCGFFGSDAIPCQVYKYKKDVLGFLGQSASTYYDTLIARYKIYLSIVDKSKEQCVRPDFLAKLSSSDEQYLISYEVKSSQVFNRLETSVSDAFINQAAP